MLGDVREPVADSPGRVAVGPVDFAPVELELPRLQLLHDLEEEGSAARRGEKKKHPKSRLAILNLFYQIWQNSSASPSFYLNFLFYPTLIEGVRKRAVAVLCLKNTVLSNHLELPAIPTKFSENLWDAIGLPVRGDLGDERRHAWAGSFKI